MLCSFFWSSQTGKLQKDEKAEVYMVHGVWSQETVKKITWFASGRLGKTLEFGNGWPKKFDILY